MIKVKTWAIDSEFRTVNGLPSVVCFCGTSSEGEAWRWWKGEPFAAPWKPEDVVATYSGVSECLPLLCLGQPLPVALVDLMVEDRLRENYARMKEGGKGGYRSLLSVCADYGVPLGGSSPAHKDRMRALIIAGGDFTPEEKLKILDYCQEDAQLTLDLCEAMAVPSDSLLRGNYVMACAHMTYNGIPWDTAEHKRFQDGLDKIRKWACDNMERAGFYKDGKFKRSLYKEFIATHCLEVPLTATGQFSKDRRVIKEIPALNVLTENEGLLSSLRMFRPAAPFKLSPEDPNFFKELRKAKYKGLDIDGGRLRTDFKPFATQTGRNAPPAASYPLVQAKWMRWLIKCPPGSMLLYADYEAQEIGIMAALSKDKAMIEDYARRDFYYQFARRAGLTDAAPQEFKKDPLRKACKELCLGVGYGMGLEAVAKKIKRSYAEALSMLEAHQSSYPDFWKWRTRLPALMDRQGFIEIVGGWKLHSPPGGKYNPNSVINYPVQATAAEMTRTATWRAVADGHKIIFNLHDALGAEIPAGDEAAVKEVVGLMEKVSEETIGLRLRVEAKVYDRFEDKDGLTQYQTLAKLLES